MTSLIRLLVLTLFTPLLCGLAPGAEDSGAAAAGSMQYKRADTKFYARGDVLRANPNTVIVPQTAVAQNGDLYTYTPKNKAPRSLYLEVPTDWVEPITPPNMPASLNIAPNVMQIREPHGDVEIAMPNAPTTFSPAADGQPLPDGAVVKTGANSTAAILFGGVASARLMPNSEAAVQQAVASTSRAVEIDLTTGGIFSKIGTQPGVSSDFRVHSPNGTAVAEAGDFALIALQDRTDVWVSQGAIDLLAPDGKKAGSIAADGKGPLRLIRYPELSAGTSATETDAASLTAIMDFIPMANQKLAALHQKSAAGVPLNANEQAYLQRIKQVPALVKLDIIAPPVPELDVLADGTVSFHGAPLSLVELRVKLKDFVATAYSPEIEVKAGPGATYAGFAAVIDAVKAATGLQYKVVGETPAKPAPPPPPPAPPKPMEVAVQADGSVKFQGATMSASDFGAKIKEAMTATPDAPVTIHADPKASYAVLAAVIQTAKKTPVNKLNMVFPSWKELTVAVHGDGTIVFHGATESIDDFTADIKAAVTLQPDLPIVIHSNPKADFAKYTAVAQAAKATGAKQVTEVQPAPQPPPPPSFNVLVQADGSIKFQDAVMKIDEFTLKIKAALAATPDAPVTLHADSKASYADISAATQACKDAPAKNFKLALTPAKELTVTVHGDGTILFHGTTLAIDAFTNEIKAAVALEPDAPIVIHSNPKADFAKYTAVVDACKATGAKQVTEMQPTPQPEKPAAPAPPKPLVVFVQADGQAKIRDFILGLSDFPAKFKELLAVAPDAPVTVHADPKAVYVSIAAVIAACKDAQPKNFSVDLPPAKELTVTVHGDGTILFHGSKLNVDEFTQEIKAAVGLFPDLPIVIHSNPKADYTKYEAVVDASKATGAKQVTEVPPTPEPPKPAPLATPQLAIQPPPPPAPVPAPAPAPQPSAAAEPLPVIAHADGTIKFQGKTMKIDEFTAKIKAAATANPNLAVIIHSNPKMDYAKFEAVVDACKNAPAKEVDVVPPAPQAPAAPVTAETPPATNAAPETPAPPTVNNKPVPAEIDLAADGALTLDGSAVTEDELKSALTTLKKSNPKNPLVMMKAPGVTKDQWMHYVDLSHSLGLKLLVKDAKGPAVAVRPPAAEGGSAVQTPPPAPETPTTNAAPAITGNDEAVPVEIELTPDGQISFLGEAVTDDELKTRLANVAQNNSKEPVVIVKDEKVTSAQVQHVVDLCHQVKLKVKIKTVRSSDMGALKPHTNLPVVLAPPPASGDKSPGRVLPVEIGLGTKGRLTFDGVSVSLDELKDRLATVAKGNPNQPVVILKQPDVSDDSADALVTVCQGVSSQLKISVKTAPSFAPPALPDNSPAGHLPVTDGLKSASAVIP